MEQDNLQHSHHTYSTLEILTIKIRQEREIKGNQIGMEEVEPSLYADDMILYTENPKDCTQKLLIHKFSEVAGYKINRQKSVAFLYTNNGISEREVKKRISFKIISKTNEQKPQQCRNKPNKGGEIAVCWEL